MGTTEIRTEIGIAAPPPAVWRVLTDLREYPSWNPMVVAAEGSPREGRRAKLRYRSSLGVELTFDVLITRSEPGQELRWLGRRLGVSGDHYFALRPTASGTQLLHGEVFRGPFAGAAGFLFRRQIPVFERFNRALKQRAEAEARRMPPGG